MLTVEFVYDYPRSSSHVVSDTYDDLIKSTVE